MASMQPNPMKNNQVRVKAWAVLLGGKLVTQNTDDGPPHLFETKEDAIDFGWKDCKPVLVEVVFKSPKKISSTNTIQDKKGKR